MISLVLILLAAGFVLWLVTVGLATWLLLRPYRLTPARAMARIGRMSPADLGLRFDDCEFIVRASPAARPINIVGWWIDCPTPSDRTVLIIHGYADSRIGALTWVPAWQAAGFNTLVIDLRAHGESGGSFTTAGLLERLDIELVAARLTADRPLATKHLFFFGGSLGAAIALAAAETTPGVTGVVIDSPVADFYHGAVTQLLWMGLPGKIVAKPGLWLTERIVGQRFASIRPTQVIERLNCPVLAMLPGDDPFLPPDDYKELAQTIHNRREGDHCSQVVDFTGATHLLPVYFDAKKYIDALNQFARTCTSDRLARASADGATASRGFQADVD